MLPFLHCLKQEAEIPIVNLVLHQVPVFGKTKINALSVESPSRLVQLCVHTAQQIFFDFEIQSAALTTYLCTPDLYSNLPKIFYL
jgi:hypothetical protein